MRFMIIANDQRSATTITDYCAAFDIFTDTFADAESAMHALQQNNGRYDLIIVEPDQPLEEREEMEFDDDGELIEKPEGASSESFSTETIPSKDTGAAHSTHSEMEPSAV